MRLCRKFHGTRLLPFADLQYGGSPLYQACALDLPETTRALLEHGASVVQVYKNKTPLQVALNNEGSRCVKVRASMLHVGVLVYQKLVLLR